MDSGAALVFALMSAAFSKGKFDGLSLKVQYLTVKCKTAADRDEIALAFDKLRAQILDLSHSAADYPVCCEKTPFSLMEAQIGQNNYIEEQITLNYYIDDKDNSLAIYVNDKNRTFDMLSFIEPFLNGVVSVSMSGVNKFIK